MYPPSVIFFLIRDLKSPYGNILIDWGYRIVDSFKETKKKKKKKFPIAQNIINWTYKMPIKNIFYQ